MMSPIFLYIIWFSIMGCIIGSFLNVVVLRFNTGKTVMGRSSCYSCMHVLRWFELIPVFSWLYQKGRCRHCSSKISSQYIKGELLTGLFFFAAAARGIGSGIDMFSSAYVIGTVYLCITFALLVIVFLYDYRHKIIPDRLSVSFALLGIISACFFSFSNGIFVYTGFHIPSWHMLIAAVLVPFPFFLVWLLSKGRFMGLGDPKLMVGMGAFLGTHYGLSAVAISFWIGTLCILLFGFYRFITQKSILVKPSKKSIMKTEIPFGPFLIIGFVFTMVTYINIFPL